MVDGPFLRKMTPLPFLSLGQRSFPRTERRTRMPWRISMSSLFIGPPRWIELEQSRLRKKISGQPDVIVSSRTNAKFPIVVSRMYAGDDPMAPALMPGFFVWVGHLAIARFQGHIVPMRKGDVQCPHCSAGFRRIELASMRGEPGEYRCPVCNSRLEKMSGITYVAYRLTVPPERAITDARRAVET